MLASLWRMSRQEAHEVNMRIAMLEQAVARAVAGEPVPGSDERWAQALGDAELWLERAMANTRDIAALIEGRAS
ncbi:hypothetical protein [Elioraea rosea]|uniref:hypothetical protein n=1 Tax=Elioraea rosea TaxID=2492390 RepID=UPI001185F968|nr:hypothetical protein [Elioraea rosea]